MNKKLEKQTTGLLVIDTQERLLAHVERPCELVEAIRKVIIGCQCMGLPIVVTEQYPEKMGPTAASLRELLGDGVPYLPKTTFSCVAHPPIAKALKEIGVKQWIVVGMEAHVCIFQSARDLAAGGCDVVVLNDAISSRSIYDYSTAIAEMRDAGIRISSVETVLFELLHDSKSPEFKEVSKLFKS